MRRIKARFAGNGPALGKKRNTEAPHPARSLRAGLWTAIRGVAPPWHSSGYAGVGAPSGLTVQRPAE